MYAGKVVEYGTVYEIYEQPRHPYTMALLAAMPDLETDSNYELYTIPGAPPNMLYPVSYTHLTLPTTPYV